MRIRTPLALAAIAILGTAPAQANCFWEVSTRVMGLQPANALLPARSWPLANLETRVQARTPGGFWNTPNWPVTQTDAQGYATIRSTHAFPDPSCQSNREFRVQVRNFDTGMQWRTVHQESETGPSGYHGILTPAPTHRVSVGDLVLGEDYSEDGVIHVEGMSPPPFDFTDGGNDTAPPADGNSDDETGGTDNGEEAGNEAGGIADHDLEAAADPCHMYRLPIDYDIEFRFGQMPLEPGPVSPDRALRTELRGSGDVLFLNRLRNHIRVENAGGRDFGAVYHCPVEVHVRLNEGPGRRGTGEDAWSPPYVERVPDLPANTEVALDRNANLLGAGDDPVGEWEQDYEYVLIEVTLDATRRITETAEGDNRIVHCYHAPSNSFAPLAQCEG